MQIANHTMDEHQLALVNSGELYAHIYDEDLFYVVHENGQYVAKFLLHGEREPSVIKACSTLGGAYFEMMHQFAVDHFDAGGGVLERPNVSEFKRGRSEGLCEAIVDTLAGMSRSIERHEKSLTW